MVIPWAALLHYGARLLGLALLGPHMHLVGKRLERAAAEAAQMESRYQAADSPTKRAMLQSVRDEQMAEAEQAIEKATSTRNSSELEKKRKDWVDANGHNLLVWPARTSGRFRFRSLPILPRSTAYPLIDYEAAAAVKTAP